MQSNNIVVVIFLAKFTVGLMKDSPIVLNDQYTPGSKKEIIMQPPFYGFREIALDKSSTGNLRFANDNPIITIPDGQIQGTKEQTIMQTTFYAFRGIPFAKPPVGDLRFAAPQKNDPWIGILNATADRDWCPQMNAGNAVGSEDCLHLSVCTPDYKGNFPLMVEIYGGGFEAGTANFHSYRPDYLLAEDVVYVALNYRIGILGFLSTGDMACPGNNGLKDQILALKWVKKYIKYFGGDPNRVTVFGQSAGGISIAYLVQSRLAKGLFHRGIMQSGSSLCAAGLTLEAPKRAFEIGELLGIKTTNSSVLVEHYRQVNVTDLLSVQTIYTTKFLLSDILTRALPFGPVQEHHHPEAVFSGNSYEQYSKGDFQRIPLMIGSTSNEAGPLIRSLPLSLSTLALFESDVTKFAPSNITQNITKRVSVGTKVKTRFIGTSPIISQLPNFVTFLGRDAFSRPIRETVRLMSKYTEIYYYQFSYKGLLGNQNREYEGASHGEDAIYLFAFPDSAATVMDLIMSDKMVTLWTNFAKTGNPTPAWSSKCSKSVLGNLVWKPNTNTHSTPDHSIQYLNINTTLRMQTNPFQEDWLFYKNLYLLYGDPPYFTY
ncbi:unnamed protein product [Ceutorhynchus assimilis]|uniref:Carboxylic ester hydrolase n=1 Tax=Ceutorhynchus assimilis TaxID=467358 RepID=A0A9N9MM72_9CUCU|nr:unnamed protein product [Ceutorhynchus assimilis]